MSEILSLLTPELAGWCMAGTGGFRWVADDVLESYGGPGLLWYAERRFDVFTLSVEWRILHADDNSGVFVHCPPLAGDPSPAIAQGYEIQIDDRGVDPRTGSLNSPLHVTGAIYERAPAQRLASRGAGEWNVFEVVARPEELIVLLNGEEVSSLALTPGADGHIALQNHHEGSRVQFRGLRVMA
jgi:hypothetical protein